MGEGDGRGRVLRGGHSLRRRGEGHRLRAHEARAGLLGRQAAPHGMCEGLRADWNDCLNLGGGESALATFLHAWAIKAFLEAARHLGKKDDVKKYTAMAEKVAAGFRTRCSGTGSGTSEGSPRRGSRSARRTTRKGRSSSGAHGLRRHLRHRLAGRGRQAAMDSVDKHLYSKYGLHLLADLLQARRRHRLPHPRVQGHQGERGHLQPSRQLGRSSRSASWGAATAP